MKTAAIIGLGSIGLRHARNLIARGVCVKGFDPHAKPRNNLNKIGCEVFDNIDEAVKNVDLCIIASPTQFHLQDLATSIQAGCHTFVEKPLAHTLQGLDELIKKADASGLVLLVGFNLRLHSAVNYAKSLLDKEYIGDLLWAKFHFSSYLPDWRKGTDYKKGYTADPVSGGVLFDLSHEFDLANYLLGPAVTIAASAYCSGKLSIASDDCADVILKHQSGIQSNLHLDYVTPFRHRHAEITGTKGIINVDIDERIIHIYDSSKCLIEEKVFTDNYDSDYEREIIHFLDCVDGNAIASCGGYDGYRVLEQVIKAREFSNLPI